MKKLIPMIVIILLFLIFPVTGDSSYRILLKNGGEFTTFGYWSEGDQIRFYVHGGIAGIQKDSIKKIEEVALVYKKSVVSPPRKPAPVPVKTESKTDIKAKDTPDVPGVAPEEAGKKTGEETEAESKEIDVEYCRRMNKELWDKYREAKERYDQSKLGRNEFIRNDAKKEIKEALDKLTELSRKLKKKNKGILPDWWQEKP